MKVRASRQGQQDPVVAQPEVADGGLSIQIQEDDDGDYPEGGFTAWMVVVGAWCAMVPPLGMMNTLAVLHAWLGENELKGIPESTTGWILSVYAFFITACGAQVGPIFDAHDIKLLLIPGSIGTVLSMVFLSLSKEFYQFLLSFGFCGGISASLLFNPALSVVGHWFCKRRALATGLACTAGGLGGIGFSLIIQHLAPRIGFPWAMRVVALISLVLLLVANVFLRKRIPDNKDAKLYMDFRLLRDAKFAITVLAIFLVEFAVFVPYSYISSYAVRSGLGLQTSLLLNTVLNAGAIPGRVLPGYVADRVGAFNTMCATSLCCGALVLGLWLTAGGIILSPVCVSRVCRIEDYGKANGITYFVASFGALVGIPIAGALVKDEGAGAGSYRALILFGGWLTCWRLRRFAWRGGGRWMEAGLVLKDGSIGAAGHFARCRAEQ
uniref:Major facilitator superfamily (MFS) profile domain-containing protein n=1 Tax=Bionectria ochroleuca TaxID=29856 RepID=A0A8H7NCK1_BIOOC